MPAAPRRERRKSTSAVIRISPFRLVVKPSNGGFVCEFSGTDSNGRKIEVELEFPPWWVHEIMNKLDVFVKGQK